MQRVYNGLIFDVDGTLFDITEYIPVFRDLMADAVYDLTGRRHKFSVNEGYIPFTLPPDESTRFLEETWGIQNPEQFWKRVEELDMQKRMQLIEMLKLFPDVEALRHLNGDFRCGILSNTPANIVKLQMDHYRMGDVFEDVLCASYKTELSKPGTKGLEILLARMGLKMNEIVYIGDSDVDHELCRNAGIPFIRVERDHSHHYTFENDHVVIDGFHQLGGALHEMQVR